jgi:hypothetical protein
MISRLAMSNTRFPLTLTPLPLNQAGTVPPTLNHNLTPNLQEPN